jgi:hypothetical protein
MFFFWLTEWRAAGHPGSFVSIPGENNFKPYPCLGRKPAPKRACHARLSWLIEWWKEFNAIRTLAEGRPRETQ